MSETVFPVDMSGMSLFDWKSELNVGHPEIDSQHQRLFRIAGEMHAAMLAGKGRAIMEKILENLVAYTKLHFASEEGLMQKHRYPEYPKHKAEHDKLTAQVVAFQKEFQIGHKSISIDLMKFLSDWLNHHIGETDRKIAAFLREKAA